MTLKVSSADYSNMSAINYPDSAPAANLTKYPNQWTVDNLETEGPTGFSPVTYQADWTKWHGYYRSIPELAAVIDKKGQWIVGNGFKLKGLLNRKGKQLDKIKGFGKDTFTSILNNMVRTYTICGDSFAEIIKDKQGRLINLKPLNPGSMRIVVDQRGMIIRYEQVAQLSTGNMVLKFGPDQIFHLAWNRIADEIHGISTIQKLELNIESLQEAKRDIKVVFHRYVKPLLITEIDSDDTAKIAEFKAKLDDAVEKGENMIVPKGVATVDRISIPQFSTLDPLPWIASLQREFLKAEGVPSLVLGASGEEDTEASAKMVYLAYEQLIKFSQRFLEEQIRNQLGIDLKFNFEASILPDLNRDNQKDGQVNKQVQTNPTKNE